MKTISIFFAVMLALGTNAPAQASEPGPGVVDALPDARNGLDRDGVYAGTIPSASGSGIDVTIILREDSTYTVRYHYVGRQDGDFTATGTFEWDATGGIVTLDAKDIPPYYRVGEGRLIQLDMEGQPITGLLADHYVLKKRPRQGSQRSRTRGLDKAEGIERSFSGFSSARCARGCPGACS
ncbi:MAG: copper resistance protein NlpE N-terminal domain-containing protein [Candidatus Accumulibacter sp.]|jgi:uncharacterized lipoprotein NlpE involved in copper resistance|nr:copper resistance protein NlpE N-terminal domain-containing protein [Accumulibacter sp.]